MHPTFDSFNQLGHIGVAWVQSRVGVDDADYGARERVFAVAERFDEDFAQEEGEVRIPVGGEILAQAGGGGEGGSEVVVITLRWFSIHA